MHVPRIGSRACSAGTVVGPNRNAVEEVTRARATRSEACALHMLPQPNRAMNLMAALRLEIMGCVRPSTSILNTDRSTPRVFNRDPNRFSTQLRPSGQMGSLLVNAVRRMVVFGPLSCEELILNELHVLVDVEHVRLMS